MSTRPSLTTPEQLFLAETAQLSNSDTVLAQLVAEKTNRPEIKHLAEDIISDGTQIRAEVLNVATQRNISIADPVPARKMKIIRWFQRFEAPKSDEQFLGYFIPERARTIEVFRLRALQTEDAKIKIFIAKQISQLEQQLSEARSLEPLIFSSAEKQP